MIQVIINLMTVGYQLAHSPALDVAGGHAKEGEEGKADTHRTEQHGRPEGGSTHRSRGLAPWAGRDAGSPIDPRVAFGLEEDGQSVPSLL